MQDTKDPKELVEELRYQLEYDIGTRVRTAMNRAIKEACGVLFVGQIKAKVQYPSLKEGDSARIFHHVLNARILRELEKFREDIDRMYPERDIIR